MEVLDIGKFELSDETEAIRNDLIAKKFKAGLKIYGLMPANYRDKIVDPAFPDADIFDNNGEFVRRKTYGEYLLIIGEGNGNIMARLLMLDHTHNFTATLQSRELEAMTYIVPIGNIFAHKDALRWRDSFIPVGALDGI